MNDNWDYHRNGICGLGFHVGLAEGALCVEFLEFTNETLDEDGEWVEEYKHHRVAVDLETLNELEVKAENLGEGQVGIYEQLRCISNCEGSAWLIRGATYSVGGKLEERYEGTYVALHAPHAPECATAILKVDLLPSVEFGHNSWRGDHWHSYISELHNREFAT